MNNGNEIKKSDKKVFLFDGEAIKVQGENDVYTIVRDKGVLTCSCPAYRFGHGAIGTKTCKHIDQHVFLNMEDMDKESLSALKEKIAANLAAANLAMEEIVEREKVTPIMQEFIDAYDAAWFEIESSLNVAADANKRAIELADKYGLPIEAFAVTMMYWPRNGRKFSELIQNSEGWIAEGTKLDKIFSDMGLGQYGSFGPEYGDWYGWEHSTTICW